MNKTITLFPGMAGVSRNMIKDLRDRGIALFSVDIMVTQACNFKCIYCYAEGSPQQVAKLTMEKAKEIVDECIELKVGVINLQGGEPLIWRPDNWIGKTGTAFFYLVDYIKESYASSKLDVGILSFTDVAPVTKETAKMLHDRGVSLCCKLDSTDEKVQDKLLGTVGGWKSMMRGYENLIQVGYGKPNSPSISTNSVVTMLNYDSIPNTFRWSRSHGFRPFVIPVHVHGRAMENNRFMLCGKKTTSTLHSDDIKRLFEKLAEIDGKEFDIHWKAASPWVENQACARQLGGIHIRADGVVLPCSEAPDHWAFGSIWKSSLKELVCSDKVKKFRDVYNELLNCGRCSPKNCPLSAKKLCYGCRTRAYDESGFDESGNFDKSKLDPNEFFGGDPACWRECR